MERHRGRSWRLVAAVASISLAGTSAAAPASAADVAVTGGSVSVIELTLSDDTAAFGTNLTPDGAASNSTDTIGANTDTAGTCYEWAGTATVRSNEAYGITATTADTKTRLYFLSADPAAQADCAAGELVVPAMFAPGGVWVTTQSTTAGRDHGFWLGLDVLWTDTPNGSLADATITLTASAGI